jgi:hypothetical protein
VHGLAEHHALLQGELDVVVAPLVPLQDDVRPRVDSVAQELVQRQDDRRRTKRSGAREARLTEFRKSLPAQVATFSHVDRCPSLAKGIARCGDTNWPSQEHSIVSGAFFARP